MTPDTMGQLTETEYVNPKFQLSELSIASNEGMMDPQLLGWLRAWPIDTPDDVLRRELHRHGVVHVKNVMPRELVMDVRKRFFERLAPTGVLKPGTEPVEAIFKGGPTDQYTWPRVTEGNKTAVDGVNSKDYACIAAQMHHEDWTNDFNNNPYLAAMVKRLQPHWQKPFCLRRQIFRTNVPFADCATSVHYDQLYLRHGNAEDVVTAWLPLGDVPPSSGGLMYLQDSHVLGKDLETEFWRTADEKGLTLDEKQDAYNRNMTEKGGLAFDAAKFSAACGNKKWLLGDYEAGDAVFHSMYTIHASGLNHDANGVIRFSVDLRFADEERDYDRRWTNVFVPGDGL